MRCVTAPADAPRPSSPDRLAAHLQPAVSHTPRRPGRWPATRAGQLEVTAQELKSEDLGHLRPSAASRARGDTKGRVCQHPHANPSLLQRGDSARYRMRPAHSEPFSIDPEPFDGGPASTVLRGLQPASSIRFRSWAGRAPGGGRRPRPRNAEPRVRADKHGTLRPSLPPARAVSAFGVTMTARSHERSNLDRDNDRDEGTGAYLATRARDRMAPGMTWIVASPRLRVLDRLRTGRARWTDGEHVRSARTSWEFGDRDDRDAYSGGRAVALPPWPRSLGRRLASRRLKNVTDVRPRRRRSPFHAPEMAWCQQFLSASVASLGRRPRSFTFGKLLERNHFRSSGVARGLLFPVDRRGAEVAFRAASMYGDRAFSRAATRKPHLEATGAQPDWQTREVTRVAAGVSDMRILPPMRPPFEPSHGGTVATSRPAGAS